MYLKMNFLILKLGDKNFTTVESFVIICTYRFLHIAIINRNTVFCSSFEKGILFQPARADLQSGRLTNAVPLQCCLTTTV